MTCPTCNTFRADESHLCPGSPEWELRCCEEDHRAAKLLLDADWARLRRSSRAYWDACKALIEARGKV